MTAPITDETKETCNVLMRAATPLDQPRAIGRARVSTKLTNGRPAIDTLRQSGALKLLFPRQENRVEAIIVNTAGGITGGDDFQIDATVGAGSKLCLTTQAAERAYRAQPGQKGQLTTTLSAQEDATLFWLPQETILYEEANLQRSLHVDLAPTARFLMIEAVLFGRQAMGEELRSAAFRDRVEIDCEGQPLYRDGVVLSGDIAGTLDRPAVGNGARAMASLIWVAPEAEGHLSRIRDLIGSSGGASMIGSNIMALRLLASDGYLLRRALVPALDVMTQNALPQSWRL